MSQQPGTSAGTPGPSRPNPVEFKEFNFRLPQNQRKKYSVMQFNRGDNVDLTKWQQAKMERENNKIHYKTDLDDLPKFGAGSEFGRERREEARQKKYGIVTQKYREQDQPWILRQGGAVGKTAKKFRGRKEGRINENSSYFILAQLGDGTFEAYPVDSWYNFTAMQNYRTLNAEEAEEEFGRRDKTMNYFSVMVQRKLKDTKDDEEKEEKSLKSRRNSDLTLMEEDYFLDSDEEEEDSDDEGRGKGKKNKQKKKGGAKNKRPKKKDFDSEAEEESDEGDFDGRELDYISESSSDDDEVELAKTDIKGLDQELQQLEEEEEEEEEGKEGGEEEGEGSKEDEGKKEKEKPKDGKKAEEDDSSSESSGSDSDIDEKNIQSAMLLQKKNTKKANDKTPPKASSASQSRSQTPTVMDTGAVTDRTLNDAAQKLENSAAKKRPNTTEQPATKRPRTESPVPMASSKTPSGYVLLTEDEVRRYLMRRPMTTKDLLVKLNPKKTGLPKEQIETKLAEILVKLAPEKRKKDNKIYWFIREHAK